MGDRRQLLFLGQGDTPVRPRQETLRPDGHGRVRLPDGQHGQTSLRDVQVSLDVDWSSSRLTRSAIADCSGTTLSRSTSTTDGASASPSTTNCPFWPRSCSAACCDSRRCRRQSRECPKKELVSSDGRVPNTASSSVCSRQGFNKFPRCGLRGSGIFRRITFPPK